MTRFVLGLAFVCFFVGGTLVCKAEEPDCAANRHFDTCAQFCPDPPLPTTTTTTLPNDSDGQCLTLVDFRILMKKYIKDAKDTDVVMAYVPCKYVKVSKKYPLGIRCPKPNYHGRVLAPVRNPLVKP